MTSKSIRTYLDQDLAVRIARASRASGRSESSLIADAVRTVLANESGGAAESAAQSRARQLGRIEARLDRIVTDQALLKESLMLFVRIWLEHNPPIDDTHAESAAASAEARFENFIHFATRSVRGQGRSADLRLEEDDDDLPYSNGANA